MGERFAEMEPEVYAALLRPGPAETTALGTLPVVNTTGIHEPKNKRKAQLNDWYVQPGLSCTGACGGKRQPAFH